MKFMDTESKLQSLRKQWLDYKAKNDTRGMQLTEMRARLISPGKIETTDKTAEDIFLRV
jgi:ribosomal protein L17